MQHRSTKNALFIFQSLTKGQTAVIQCHKRMKCFANRPFIDLYYCCFPLTLLFTKHKQLNQQLNHIRFIVH